MPTWLRTLLAPPSQPMSQRARTVEPVPSQDWTDSDTPSGSWLSPVISVLSATVTFGSCTTRSRYACSTGGCVNTSDGM